MSNLTELVIMAYTTGMCNFSFPVFMEAVLAVEPEGIWGTVVKGSSNLKKKNTGIFAHIFQ